MSELAPGGESMRRAVRWISDQLRENPDQKLTPLLDQAMRRFDLSPLQGEQLIEFFRARRATSGGDT